ncbi:hypothetical protein BKM35_22120 [Salmonella enterica]|nr:hypothetical protein [Salmonella enterica]
MKNLSNQDLINRIEKHEASTKELLNDIENASSTTSNEQDRNWLSLAKMNTSRAFDALRHVIKPTV